MTVLTRQHIVEQIEASGASDSAALARWAFDQFYAEEEGAIEFETGYRRILGAALDELMFADEPRFQLSVERLRALAAELRAARPGDDEDEDEDDEDD